MQVNEDFALYNDLTNQMIDIVQRLEEKYGQRLPGSPTWGDVLDEYYRSDPTNEDFQKGRLLAKRFDLLNLEISSDPNRAEVFLSKMR